MQKFPSGSRYAVSQIHFDPSEFGAKVLSQTHWPLTSVDLGGHDGIHPSPFKFTWSDPAQTQFEPSEKNGLLQRHDLKIGEVKAGQFVMQELLGISKYPVVHSQDCWSKLI